MKIYLINETLIKALIGYLNNRPYQEVAEGIKFLQNLPELEEEKANEQIQTIPVLQNSTESSSN